VMTPDGGIAVTVTNGTGSASVKGSLVSASPTADNSVILQTNEYDTVGIVYDGGVADGNKMRIVVAGIAKVLFKNSVQAVRGYVAIAADTDGRATNIDVPSSNPVVGEHFKEIGHVLENKNGSTDVLVKCFIHFN